MEQASLNLARKWRSTQFQEIVGQDLVVRILQNSLFKNQFFPVYLLSGQRGCGKTSTARVFASALNCHKLAEFQQNAKIKIPCLQCLSCVAMSSGRHPDFIEIDAASYTGVDNIRNIIDTSSFLPVLGQRKIYLIDEVHMLSKAAFNAFLKILEEPPKFVVFILATTEAQKLPDTVRSRCFQLFFNAVQVSVVVSHLEAMCKKESISYEVEGLEMIAIVSQGSLRDAINLLEQARFAANLVSKSVVLGVLGYPEDEKILQVLQAIVHKDQVSLMSLFATWSNLVISIDYVVKRCIELLYDGVVIKYGSTAKYLQSDQLIKIVEQATIQDLIICFDELCSIDMMIAKTSKKQLLFESLMLRLSLRDELQKSSLIVASSNHETVHDEKKKKSDLSDQRLHPVSDTASQWDMFVRVVAAHVDPVLASILYATSLTQFDQSQKIVRVTTLKKFVLFQDLFIEQKQNYQKYLDGVFGFQATLIVEFTQIDQPKKIEQKIISKVDDQPRKQLTQSITMQNSHAKVLEKPAEFADKTKWKITHMLLEHFGGTVREIVKDTHEFDA